MEKTQAVIAKTVILTGGDKPLTPIKGFPAANPHQPDRIEAMYGDRMICVAHRGGKGGIDINKIAGGKVLAVAADGFAPAFEKDAEGKQTTVQKTHNGLPMYVASGFYVLSGKEYVASGIIEGYGMLINGGDRLVVISEAQMQATASFLLTERKDLIALRRQMIEWLDGPSLVAGWNDEFNRKRRRAIQRAKEEAEDSSVDYAGVQFAELKESPKDGSPCLVLTWQHAFGEPRETILTREVIDEFDPDRPVAATGVEAVDGFWRGPGCDVVQAVKLGRSLTVFIATGHVMRTSVSFKLKVQNLSSGVLKRGYGDAVFIESALRNWTKTIAPILPMLHPQFPAKDYDVLHYVAAPRQAEVKLVREQSENGDPAPLRPKAIAYDMRELQREAFRRRAPSEAESGAEVDAGTKVERSQLRRSPSAAMA